MFQGFIRITSRPAGDAPRAIRDKWIGLVLPVHEEVRLPKSDVVRNPKGERVVGYEVRWEDAMRILGDKHPDARLWWERAANRPARLIFEESCCKVARDFEL